jgi:hypothetical protein
VGTYELGTECPDESGQPAFPCATGLLIRDQDLSVGLGQDYSFYDGRVVVESVTADRLKGHYQVRGARSGEPGTAGGSVLIEISGTFDVPLTREEFIFSNFL